MVSSMRELSFFPVEPNDLGHRTRVPSGMSPNEPTYATTRDIGDLPSEALYPGMGDPRGSVLHGHNPDAD